MIYLDYAATTPIDSKVLRKILPYLKEDYGNPSSIHILGQKALIAIDKAREEIAKFLSCSSEEIIFTGSATEANNLAIKGIIEGLGLRINRSAPCNCSAIKQASSFKSHIIVSQIEHHAVLEPCHQLEKKGLAEVTYLPVNKEGLISVSALEKAIKPNTVLISIMYANNEIGTIQPIAEMANVIRHFRNSESQIPKPKQYPISNAQYPIFHTDAVQAINYLDCDVKKLEIDLLTLSAHKIYGPKGVGALFVKKGTEISAQILGGGHEFDLRSGTENVAGIVGLGEAIKEIKNQRLKIKDLEKLRNKLIDGILKNIPGSKLNGSRKNRLPNNANLTFEGAEGEALVIALDQEGICASTGSSCSSRSLEPSHVLLALGLSYGQAHGSLRLTLGRYTTEKEIGKVLRVLPKIVERLRKISGYRI